MNLLVVDSSAMTIRSKDHPLDPSNIWGLRMSLTWGAHQVAHNSDGENIQASADVESFFLAQTPWLTTAFEKGLW